MQFITILSYTQYQDSGGSSASSLWPTPITRLALDHGVWFQAYIIVSSQNIHGSPSVPALLSVTLCANRVTADVTHSDEPVRERWPLTWEITDVLTRWRNSGAVTHREETMWRETHKNTAMWRRESLEQCSHKPRNQRATKAARARTDPLGDSEGAQSSWHLDFEHLASRTMRE